MLEAGETRETFARGSAQTKGRSQEEKAKALQVMTAEDLQAFADGIWQHAHVESLMMGNLDSSEARVLGERIREYLPGGAIPDGAWRDANGARTAGRALV